MVTREEQTAVERAATGQRASASGWVRVNCPLCLDRTGKADRKGALGVHWGYGRFACFKCGARGRVEQQDDQAPAPAAAPPSAIRPPQGFTRLDSDDGRYALCFEQARRYLAGRGLQESVLFAAGVGACAEGPSAGRVVVPVLGESGTWRGWVSRAWVKDHPKPYLYPAGMQRGSMLYNQTALWLQTDQPVLVVEGVFDALALWPHAVAVLGKPSHEQVDLLCSATRPVVAALDGDAHVEGLSLALQLRLRECRAGALRLPPEMDPDELGLSVLLEAASKSIAETYPVEVTT